MEGTIGEVRLFAGSFAPRSWAFCQGQLIAIRSNTALFSILGIQYGGDGKVTFGLPNLSSRTAIGAGSGNGLTPYTPGDETGSEGVAIITTEMPAHIHIGQATPGAPGSATATLMGVESVGDLETPGGNYLAQDGGSGGSPYATPGSGTGAPMATTELGISTVTAPVPTVSVAPTGGSQAHENRQPFLAMNYIICLEGYFPPRN